MSILVSRFSQNGIEYIDFAQKNPTKPTAGAMHTLRIDGTVSVTL
jgi:hypothetical protein